MIYKEKECIMTIELLDNLCEQWKIILGLESWMMRIKLVTRKELPQSQGDCKWNDDNREAYIRILQHDQWDYDPWKHDMETVLVHEMMHCVFAPLDHYAEGTPMGTITEQIIDYLSKTMVELRRESYSKALTFNVKNLPTYDEELLNTIKKNIKGMEGIKP